MEPLNANSLAAGTLVLVDTAPIIYILEGHPKFAARFEPVFRRHAAGDIRIAVSTVTIAEVLVGPLQAGAEAVARRYRNAMESWQVVDCTADIAESAARLRVRYRLKLPDAIQLASALAINAAALLTHDRDFSRVSGIRILT